MAIDLFEVLFGELDSPLKRAPYAAVGFSFALLKYIGDAGLIEYGTGNLWRPLDYLNSVQPFLLRRLPSSSYLVTLALMLWMVPFVWIGVTFTLRRARDAGWSPWWALVFFVPYANYALMLALCLWPSSEKYALTDPGIGESEGEFARNGAIGVAAGVLFGLLMIGIAVVLKGNYAFALFIGTPVGMGAFAGFFVGRDYEPEFKVIFSTTLLMLVVTFGVLVFVAFEGVVCIAMAFPFALALALIGAALGRAIAVGGRSIRKPAASFMMLLPILALIEPAHLTGHVMHEVHSAIEINAPPELVWPQLVQSAPMAQPTELMFRLGIAYPIGTHTDGAGIGATRYCEFSTGSIVEPITAWDPGKRLAFDVISQPAPLTELSLYKDVTPPHLHGYVRSKRGEFRLIALPGGRTRLDGTSWYELEMAPETYWSLWVDSTVHSVHYRVFREIKKQAEAQVHASAEAR
jgi:uncharacterized membrane protein YhaH (DUF805 family)